MITKFVKNGIGAHTRSSLQALDDVAEERGNQDRKWGVQEHSAEKWMRILMEEVGEAAHAINEGDPLNYREELIQVAAVAVAAVESLERGNW